MPWYAIEGEDVWFFDYRALRDAWVECRAGRRSIKANEVRSNTLFDGEYDNDSWRLLAQRRVEGSVLLRKHSEMLLRDQGTVDHWQRVALDNARDLAGWAKDAHRKMHG